MGVGLLAIFRLFYLFVTYNVSKKGLVEVILCELYYT